MLWENHQGKLFSIRDGDKASKEVLWVAVRSWSDIYLWTITVHWFSTVSLWAAGWLAACLLNMKASDPDSIGNQVLYQQWEFAFCIFTKCPQWFTGLPVLFGSKWFPRLQSLRCTIYDSPTRGSHDSRLIFPYVELFNSYIMLSDREKFWSVVGNKWHLLDYKKSNEATNYLVNNVCMDHDKISVFRRYNYQLFFLYHLQRKEATSPLEKGSYIT